MMPPTWSLSRHGGVHALGMLLLIGLFAAGVAAASRSSIGDQLTVRLEPLAQSNGRLSRLSADGMGLRVPAEAGAAIRMHFVLPPPVAGEARWMLWVPREPVDAVWLQAADGWRTEPRDFFRPAEAEGLLPGGYAFPLPPDWHGDVVLELHARSATRATLAPRVVREDMVMRLGQRSTALHALVYAGLFMMAFLSLALYSASRERSFLHLFASACTAGLLLAAQNGHLYAMPFFGLFSAWRGQGLRALLLLFCASVLQTILSYDAMREATTRAVRWSNGYSVALVALVALFLLDLRVLDAWAPAIGTLGWIGAIVVAGLALAGAVARRVPMSVAIATMLGITALAGVVREAVSQGWVVDMVWTRHGYQLAILGLVSMLATGLIGRISEYRDQVDRDRLARDDSERRMQREAARAELALALQNRLRTVATADLEWTAFRLLLEHLLPQMAAETAAVIAHGYHGRDLLVAEPADHKQLLQDHVARRAHQLKQLASTGVPLQQPAGADGAAADAMEALVPLPIRAPGWGMLMMRRQGREGFSTEEMAIAGEFVRLAVLHADEALAAQHLRRSAELDALTGTFNRRTIDQWLARGFTEAHRDQHPLSLLFVDIDHFKAINDRFGHACGDHCLRQVAATLRDALGEADMLGRYGGEEFVAILPGRAGADARAVGEQLRTAVEHVEIEWEGKIHRLTVSIGVATRLPQESTPAAAVERADKALYAAKRGGRNCVQVAPAVFS